MSFTVQTLMTNTAKSHISAMLQFGSAFKVTHFEVGDGGSDPDDPLTAIAPDSTITETPGKTYGPKAIDSADETGDYCRTFTCTLEPGEATGGISAITLIGTFVYVDASDTRGIEVGDTFVFSIGTRPLLPKTDGDGLVFELEVSG